jgi:hypothetical protein
MPPNRPRVPYNNVLCANPLNPKKKRRK